MDYILDSSEDKSLTALLSSNDIIASATTILNTLDVNKSTNWDKIKRQYSAQELQENEPLYPTGAVLVKKNTPIFIFNAYVSNVPLKSQAAQLKQQLNKLTSFKPFVARRLAELLKDPQYKKLTYSQDGLADTTLESNGVTVYIWCRALSSPNSNSQQGDWINVSSLVNQISTQVTAQVGSFSFKLPSVSGKWFPVNGWTFDSSVYEQSMQTSIVKQNSLTKNTKRETFLFNTILQENDLVYIKMERLAVDETNVKRGDDLSVAGEIWDMIGLIDSVSVETGINTSNVSVQGRDLTKLLIEDGSFFFPEQFGQDIFTDKDSILTKRNRFELQAQSLATASYTFKSIETIMKFIFNKFSNIGIVPNSVFNGYGTDATRSKYQIKTSELKRLGDSGQLVDQLNDEFLKEERQGAWRICDFIFDPAASNRILADNNISQDNGSIINSIRKFCQQPFVEFYGDTYKDRYNFIIRRQPFDREGYVGLVYSNYVIEEPPIENDPELFEDSFKSARLTSRIFQNGASLAKSGGIKKKVKDKIKLGRILDIRPSSLSELVIDIEDNEVLNEPQFVYQNDEAYSWYRIIPQGLGNLPDTAKFILAPVVPFDEYAEIWGNKTCSVEYNYCPMEFISDNESQQRIDYIEAQTFYDLQFLIQSHQYLPFTRKGTIVLVGNRTIKRGMFIYYKPTNEVFYVDSVMHDRTIGNAPSQNVRTTTLQVSRGMREPYIKGKWIAFNDGLKLVSYFEIINTKVDNNASINNNAFLKNWKVNKSIFNFFVQRRQWAD